MARRLPPGFPATVEGLASRSASTDADPSLRLWRRAGRGESRPSACSRSSGPAPPPLATDTTLRTTIAVDQAREARQAGFFTTIVYIATREVEINIERIRVRGLAGGHSASPETIRDNYARSLGNLAIALRDFDRGDVYDNSDAEPRLLLSTRGGRLAAAHLPIPKWVNDALTGTSIAKELEATTG